MHVNLPAATRSDVSGHGRKDDHDDCRLHGIDGQIIRLPPLEGSERSAPSQKSDVQPGGPRQVAQKNHAAGATATRNRVKNTTRRISLKSRFALPRHEQRC